MTTILRHALSAVTNLLLHDEALPSLFRRIHHEQGRTGTAFTADQVQIINASQELLDKKLAARYPLVLVSCDRLRRSASPQFCKFAGTLRTAIEVRVSSDRIDDLEAELHSYTDAVIEILLRHQGSWTESIYFDGNYEIQFSPAKPGARHFVQSSRILIELALTVL